MAALQEQSMINKDALLRKKRTEKKTLLFVHEAVVAEYMD